MEIIKVELNPSSDREQGELKAKMCIQLGQKRPNKVKRGLKRPKESKKASKSDINGGLYFICGHSDGFFR